MKTRKSLTLIIVILFSACQAPEIRSPVPLPTVETSSSLTPVFQQPSTTAIQPMLPVVTVSPAPEPTVTPEPSPTPIAQPVIHDQSGEMYEVVFSIPVGKDSVIQYHNLPGTIEGPDAIAILPDGSVMILDFASNHLLHYDLNGKLQKIIVLDDLGIKLVRDLRIKGNELFLLQTFYQEYRVHRLTLDGALIASEEVPYLFPIGYDDNKLENSLTGIAVDCQGNILLEVASGSILFHLKDVQSQAGPEHVTQGYFCDEKRYWVANHIFKPGANQKPEIASDDIHCETQLTYGLGGFRLLDVFSDGGFYGIRDDMVNAQVVKVDQTVFLSIRPVPFRGWRAFRSPNSTIPSSAARRSAPRGKFTPSCRARNRLTWCGLISISDWTRSSPGQWRRRLVVRGSLEGMDGISPHAKPQRTQREVVCYDRVILG